MVVSSRAAGALGVLLALHAGACAPAEPRIAWSIDFAEDVAPADARASVVHASIRAGDCSSTDAIYVADLAFGESAPEPPSLSAGTWAFVAEAVDPSCSVIASDCVTVTVPLASDTPVQLLLRATDPYALCAASECRSGRCGGADDGGVDAGVLDATVVVDACAPSETRCTDGVDEDCDGATDCADADCAGASCGASSSCCGGACIDTRTSNSHCGGCGNACDTVAQFVCAAGSCECVSGWLECTAGSCTNVSASETSCGTCGNACAADLVCNDGTCGPARATWSTRRFPGADCPTRIGMTYQYDCEANPTLSGSWNVYGTDTYYSLSDICPSAVHAGRITAAAGGVVTVRIADGASYSGSTRNGITSSTRSSGACSFTFD